MTVYDLRLLLQLLIFFYLSTTSTSASDDASSITGFVYAGCSQPKYSPGSPYQYNLNSLLASLSNSAGLSNYNNFTSSAASPYAPVYGLYQCRGDLAVPECESCVRAAINQLSALCSSSSSAALQLRGCLIRYGNDTFLGLPDKTLLYKKCGPPAGGYGGSSTDLASTRDSVLAGLLAGQGPYRLGRSGYVEGSAQCVGDQTPKQCGDCVAEAVARLKDGCGTGGAASAQVYLGKCYAEYSPAGGDPSSSSFPSSSSSSRVYHAEASGKDLAIILGIAAALLLVILMVYFLSRSGGVKGK